MGTFILLFLGVLFLGGGVWPLGLALFVWAICNAVGKGRKA